MISEEELYEVSVALRVFDSYCNRFRSSSHFNYKSAIDIATPNNFVEALSESCDKERPSLIKDLKKASNYLEILTTRLEILESDLEKSNG